MTDTPSGGPEPPDRPPGKRALIEALRVRRNTARGFAAAAVVSLALFAFFVLVPGTTRPMALYAGLLFVLLLSLGALFTAVLVAVRAYRLV